jgi:hypothetical protein
MNRSRYRAVYRASLGAALATWVTSPFCARAFAQDSGEPSFKPTPSTAPAATDQSNQLLGPIQRLPASAYPTDPVRGIYGGSLWRTFNGLQWPYYPKTGIGVSGYVWFDTGYEHIARGGGASTDPNITYFVQQGRMVLRVTPTWSDGRWFVQGQAELVGEHDQSAGPPLQPAVDDLWVKVGQWNNFDFQIGRFMGWEIYHFGMGLDLYTLERQGATDVSPNTASLYPAIYGVTTEMYYPQSVGQAALHFYPTPWLRFEWQGRYGQEGSFNTAGTRPVGIVDFGVVKFKFGAEYQHQSPQNPAPNVNVDWGAGAALQFVLDPVMEFGLNAAYGNTYSTNATNGLENPQATTYTMSYGGFLNARLMQDLLAGLGLDYTYLQDKRFDPNLGRYEDSSQWQGFVALQYLLLKHLFIKGVAGYALAFFNPNLGSPTWENHMVSGRVRLEYLF